MSDKERAALEALKKSGKYGALPEETVERAFERALAAHSNLKAADKAARAALHQMSPMYFTEKERKRAFSLMAADGTLEQLFELHASTRERLGSMDALFDRVFRICADAVRIVDYACGLNPLYLGRRGFDVLGIDIHADAVALVNEWARRACYPAAAEIRDIVSMEAYPDAHLALAMKLLPVLDKQSRGAAEAFLMRVRCKFLLVTFPTKSLGGRGGHMEAHYDGWLLKRLPDRFSVRDRFVEGNELCYLLEERDG